jgi:hypothetical protein
MKQHLHNRIGNLIGQRKQALYSALRHGADFDREIDSFIEDISAELKSVIPPGAFPDADTEITEQAAIGKELFPYLNEDPYKPTVLEPHAGREGVAEIERLAKASLGQGDDFDQHMALLELLTHLLPHDGSGWTMYARNAVIRDSTLLLDEVADVLVAREQHKRRIASPA